MKKITFSECGKKVGISRQAASEFCGKLDFKPASVEEFILLYCEHLRAVAAGRLGAENGLDLTAERARLAKLQADRIEREMEIEAGKYILAEEVEEAWGSEFDRVKNKLLSIPAKLAPSLVGLTKAPQAFTILKDEVHHALNELSQPGDDA